MKHNANIIAKGSVLGSSASISSINAIHAISVGAQSATSGTVVLSNANSISFGVGTNNAVTGSVDIVGTTMTIQGFPYMHMDLSNLAVNAGNFTTAAGTTTTAAQLRARGYLVPYNVSHTNVQAAMFHTLIAAGVSQTGGIGIGLYTQTGDTLSLYKSYEWGWRMNQNGNSETFSTYNVSTSNSATTSSNALLNAFEGNRFVTLETNAGSILAAGYYCLVNYITVSESGAGTLGMRQVHEYITSSAGVADAAWPVKTFMQTHLTAFEPPDRYMGIMASSSSETTNQINFLPGSFELSRLSTTASINTSQGLLTPFIHWEGT